MKDQDLINWTVRQAQLVCAKFYSEDNIPVSFDDILSLCGSGEVELSPGVIVVCSRRDDDTVIINCVMHPGSVLSIHHHPDYDERFEIVEGTMIDDHFDIMLNAGDVYTFRHGIPHVPLTVTGCRIKIICKKLIV